jgi:hypothetical protein
MNNMPSNVDNLLSLLGEVDIIKNALSSFEKSVNVALASDEISQLIGPPGHFSTLKKLEMVHASLLTLNVDLVGIAELLVNASSLPINVNSPQSTDPVPSNPPASINSSKESEPKNNPVVNNILEYLDERMKDEGEDE